MIRDITCERFHDGSLLHGPTRILVEDGVVRRIEPHTGTCEYGFVAPGLVDLQMNGWADVDVAEASMSDLERLGAALAALGTTSWLATLITAPLEVLTERVARVHEALVSGRVPGLVGIHLEGPFLGRSPGAHPRSHIVPPDRQWIAALPASVRLVTLAAETPGAPDAIAQLVGRGIRVSIGHSAPTRDELSAALRAGASMVTHLFNGMSGVHHRDGGLALWALTNPSLHVGVIADMVHLCPEAVLLPFLLQSGAQPYLVSDSVAWASPRALSLGVSVTDGAPRLADGTIAGSATSLAECVRRAVGAGVEPSAALVAASSRPARLVGRDGLGAVAEGEPADLVFLDADLRVVEVLPRLPSGRA